MHRLKQEAHQQMRDSERELSFLRSCRIAGLPNSVE